MAVVAMLWKIMRAAHKGVWPVLVWALTMGSGVAATALRPWDGAEASVNVLSDGEYAISAAADQECVLTTNGSEVAASVAVTIPDVSTTVTLRLREVCLKKDGVVLRLEGGGTLRVVAERGTSVLRRVGTGAGEAVKVQNDGTLAFSGEEGAPLWVFAQSGASASRAISTNIGSAFAFGTVLLEGGELHVVAGGGKVATEAIPPAIEAKRIGISGGTLSVGFSFSVASAFSVSDLAGMWPSALSAAKGVTVTGGALIAEPKAKPLPSATFGKVTLPSSPVTADKVVAAMGGSSYRYPEEAFGEVQAVAQGGQVGGKAFLRFQAQGDVSAETLAAHIVSGKTGANPSAGAVEVDTERGVVEVDVATCPEPGFAFADEGMAGATELFGCIPDVSEKGVRVDYAFGLSWLGPVRVEGEEALRVAVRVAVRLPRETAQSRTFKLLVSRTLDNGEKVRVFEGAVPFVRRSGTDTLYETAPFPTSDSFSGAFGTYRYRVTAAAE